MTGKGQNELYSFLVWKGEHAFIGDGKIGPVTQKLYLVQRCHQLELPALAEIAVGKAVALTVMMPVRYKVIIAVAVKGVFLEQKAGNVIGTAQLAVPVKFRAVCPCLVRIWQWIMRSG